MSGVLTAQIQSRGDMAQFLNRIGKFDQGIVIKPNWTSGDYGFYTDAEAMELLLRELSGPIYVVESFMFGRTDGTIEIRPDNGREHWEWLREQDKRFLAESGIGELLERYDAEYINVTEEWWSGRCMPEEEIRSRVESRYAPIRHKELYNGVPRRLYELRHLPFVSYAKFKYNDPDVSNFSSFSMKNVFGMIPVPNREFYHGADQDIGLSRSIIDIVSIYRSLFEMYGIVEGVYKIPVTRKDGENRYEMIWTEYDVIEDAGIIIGSQDLLTLDAYANKLVGIDPDTRAFLRFGSEVFGQWNREELSKITPSMKAIFR